jgi:hypothetical protein
VDRRDVTGEHRREHLAAGRRDGHHRAALVVGGGRAGDETALVEQLRLVRQAAATVDDTVREIRHPLSAVRAVAQSREQLELHVAQLSGIAELLLDGVAKQAAHVGEREVGVELHRGEAGGEIVHETNLALASSSKQC